MPETELKKFYYQMHKDGSLVDPKSSAEKLLKYLLDDVFENGSHIDYYDLINY